ncbi:MAG TPA: DNA polymerase III subunit delta [Candidatus Gracilibacteria bacterium]
MIPNLILLTGADTYSLFQRKRFYQKAFRNKYADGEIETFEASHDLSSLENAVLTPNLFGSKRLIFTEGFWTPEKFEQAEKSNFFQKLLEATEFCTIMVVEPNLDKRVKWTKFLLSDAKSEVFEPLDETALHNFLIKYAQSRGGQLSLALSRDLVSRAGNDLWMLTQEIEKLILSSDDGAITKALIQELTLKRTEVVIWSFLENLSKQNIPQALILFHGLIDMGESPHQIMAMMIREIRIHAQIRSGLDQHLDSKTIATRTNLHPFVVQKTLPLSRHFTMDQIRTMYQGLYDLDRRMKTGGLQMSTDDSGELILGMEKLMIQMQSHR